ncbi:hypothetical protein ASG52_25350 [Methylobacterium sp. Leaf456]|nr:hypothetical protein ASG52_25350 [Methylobacterium sp. Leaf456]
MIYNRRAVKVRMLITSLSKHANVATRNCRNKWHLEWHNHKIVIVFARKDDWNFFNSTYMDQHEWTLRRDGLIPPPSKPLPLPGATTDQQHKSASALLLDQIRAQITRG